MTFHFSGLLLRFVDYRRTITLPSSTLGEALKLLHQDYPQLRPVLQDNTGKVRGTHRLFLNGNLVASPSDDMPLAEGDNVEFLTAIAGG
ncbi:MoaD/ThiS family protein [Streptomyces sp. NPDC002520]